MAVCSLSVGDCSVRKSGSLPPGGVATILFRKALGMAHAVIVEPEGGVTVKGAP
jgi:hypothetical protein